MKARLMRYAAPWLIALGMLANAPAQAAHPTGAPSSPTSALAQPVAKAATAAPRLAWDRVGAPMQALA